MDEHELSDHILRRLAIAASRGDIVMDVCVRTGLSWPEAEALVERVRVDRSGEIARRQLPVLLPLAVGSMIGGIVTLLAASYPAISPWLGLDAGRGAPLAAEPDLASAFSWMNPSTLQMIFLGAALLVGGAWGLWKAVHDT